MPRSVEAVLNGQIVTVRKSERAVTAVGTAQRFSDRPIWGECPALPECVVKVHELQVIETGHTRDEAAQRGGQARHGRVGIADAFVRLRDAVNVGSEEALDGVRGSHRVDDAAVRVGAHDRKAGRPEHGDGALLVGGRRRKIAAELGRR